MLQVEIDAEIETAFKGLMEKLPPDAVTRSQWMEVAKEGVNHELSRSIRVTLREAIAHTYNSVEMLWSTHPTRQQ
jgi:hypothetical protein